MIKFEHLTLKYPKKSLSFRKLFDFFETSDKRGHDLSRLQLTPARLKKVLESASEHDVVSFISILVNEKVFDRFFIVVGPRGGAIHEFRSMYEVPSVIHSVEDDVDVAVTPDMVKTVYRFHVTV